MLGCLTPLLFIFRLIPILWTENISDVLHGTVAKILYHENLNFHLLVVLILRSASRLPLDNFRLSLTSGRVILCTLVRWRFKFTTSAGQSVTVQARVLRRMVFLKVHRNSFTRFLGDMSPCRFMCFHKLYLSKTAPQVWQETFLSDFS